MFIDTLIFLFLCLCTTCDITSPVNYQHLKHVILDVNYLSDDRVVSAHEDLTQKSPLITKLDPGISLHITGRLLVVSPFKSSESRGNKSNIKGRKNILACHNASVTSSQPWIALIFKGGPCSMQQKFHNVLMMTNASGVIVVTEKPSDIKEQKYDFEKIGILVSRLPIAHAVVFNDSIFVNASITINKFYMDSVISRTSVLLVSIAFILFMIISLVWLTFYYIQRFRYMHAKERLSRRLANAAKKALNKIPIKILVPEDQEVANDFDQCAICIDSYKVGEAIRILPCKHIFHKMCIDSWLIDQRSCPMCKVDILKACGVGTGPCETGSGSGGARLEGGRSGRQSQPRHRHHGRPRRHRYHGHGHCCQRSHHHHHHSHNHSHSQCQEQQQEQQPSQPLKPQLSKWLGHRPRLESKLLLGSSPGASLPATDDASNSESAAAAPLGSRLDRYRRRYGPPVHCCHRSGCPASGAHRHLIRPQFHHISNLYSPIDSVPLGRLSPPLLPPIESARRSSRAVHGATTSSTSSQELHEISTTSPSTTNCNEDTIAIDPSATTLQCELCQTNCQRIRSVSCSSSSSTSSSSTSSSVRSCCRVANNDVYDDELEEEAERLQMLDDVEAPWASGAECCCHRPATVSSGRHVSSLLRCCVSSSVSNGNDSHHVSMETRPNDQNCCFIHSSISDAAGNNGASMHKKEVVSMVTHTQASGCHGNHAVQLNYYQQHRMSHPNYKSLRSLQLGQQYVRQPEQFSVAPTASVMPIIENGTLDSSAGTKSSFSDTEFDTEHGCSSSFEQMMSVTGAVTSAAASCGAPGVARIDSSPPHRPVVKLTVLPPQVQCHQGPPTSDSSSSSVQNTTTDVRHPSPDSDSSYHANQLSSGGRKSSEPLVNNVQNEHGSRSTI